MHRSLVALTAIAAALLVAGCPGTAPTERRALDGSVVDQLSLFFADASAPDRDGDARPDGPADGAISIPWPDTTADLTGGAIDAAVDAAVDATPIDATSVDGSTQEALRSCQRRCQSPDDCCPTPPCDSYPSRFACDAAGLCNNLGCAGVADCGYLPGGSCMAIEGFNVCALSCTKDVECTLAGEVCVDGRYCSASTPAQPPPCGPSLPCPATPVISKCYEAAGRCGCSDGAACQATFGAGGGSWTCAAD